MEHCYCWEYKCDKYHPRRSASSWPDCIHSYYHGYNCPSCNRKDEEDNRFSRDRDEWKHEAAQQQRLK